MTRFSQVAMATITALTGLYLATSSAKAMPAAPFAKVATIPCGIVIVPDHGHRRPSAIPHLTATRSGTDATTPAL